MRGEANAERARGAPARGGVAPASRATAPGAGFTLIELLVVVVIAGVLAAALALAVGGSGERRLENASEAFRALAAHACGEAELGGRDYGVLVSPEGYAFRRLDGATWNEPATAEWRERRWPSGLRVALSREGRPLDLAAAPDGLPQIVCFSSGELTPFDLTLGLGDPPLRYRVAGTDDGTLKAGRLEAAP